MNFYFKNIIFKGWDAVGTGMIIGTTAIAMFLGVGFSWLFLKLFPKKEK